MGDSMEHRITDEWHCTTYRPEWHEHTQPGDPSYPAIKCCGTIQAMCEHVGLTDPLACRQGAPPLYVCRRYNQPLQSGGEGYDPIRLTVCFNDSQREDL